MVKWGLRWQRPNIAQGSQLPGVLVVSGGVPYYLHEDAPEDVAESSLMPFYRVDGGFWEALTGPHYLEAASVPPTAGTYTSAWWRRVQAFDYGAAGLVFAGWKFVTHTTVVVDAYGVPGYQQIGTYAPLVRVYDPTGDSWTDYEYTDASDAGFGGWNYKYDPEYPQPAADSAAWANWTSVARDPWTGHLHMATKSSVISFNPSTGIFGAKTEIPGRPMLEWWQLSGTFDVYLSDFGWFGFVGADGLSGGLCGADHLNGWVSGPSASRLWVFDGTDWHAGSGQPMNTGWPYGASGVSTLMRPDDPQAAWTYQANNDTGATAVFYGAKRLASAPEAGEAPIQTFRYESTSGVPLDMGSLPLTGPDLGVANLYAGADGVFAVTQTGIYKWSPTGDLVAPTIHFHEPASASTVGGLVNVTVHAADNVELASVRLYYTPASGVLVQSFVAGATIPPGQTDAVLTLQWNSTLHPDGGAVLYAYATDTAGNQSAVATLPVTIDNAGGVTDTEAPVVSITIPETGSSVSGSGQVSVVATDNVSVTTLRLIIGGVQVGSDVSVSGQSVEQVWEVDWSTWANGTVVVTCYAWDAAGNQGMDTVTVTVDNLTALTEKVLYTAELPLAGQGWRLGSATPLVHKLDVVAGDVPADPRQQYNVYPFCKTRTAAGAAIPADYTTYDAISVDDVVAMPPGAAAVRYALVARPVFRSAFWAVTDVTSGFRLLPIGDRATATDWLLVTRTPARVYRFVPPDLTLVQDVALSEVPAATVYEAAYRESKAYLGTELGLLAVDLDSGDEPILAKLGTDAPATSGLASGSGLFVRQEGKLHTFAWDKTVVKAAQVPAGIIWADASYLFATEGNASTDRLQRWVGSGGDSWGGEWALFAETAATITRVWRADSGANTMDLWLGCVQGIMHCTPTATAEVTFASGQVNAFASWRGTMWAAGTIGGLWWRTTEGWALYDALAGFSSVLDMAVIGDRLFVVGIGAAGGARVEAFYVDVAGDFQCGPEPPDLVARVLDYAQVQEA